MLMTSGDSNMCASESHSPLYKYFALPLALFRQLCFERDDARTAELEAEEKA